MLLVYEKDTLLLKTSNNSNAGKPSLILIMSQQTGTFDPVYPFICKLDTARIYSEGVLRLYTLRLKFKFFVCFRIMWYLNSIFIQKHMKRAMITWQRIRLNTVSSFLGVLNYDLLNEDWVAHSLLGHTSVNSQVHCPCGLQTMAACVLAGLGWGWGVGGGDLLSAFSAEPWEHWPVC